MLSKLVVAAVLVIVAVAVWDFATRGGGGEEGATVAATTEPPDPDALVRGGPGRFVPDGNVVRTRILLDGTEYLGAEEIASAFPEPAGRFDLHHIDEIAVAPDGTLVVGVLRYRGTRPPRAALELWLGRSLLSSFRVRPSSFAGGLGFTLQSGLVAGYSFDGRSATLFDRSGRLVREVSVS